MLPDLPQPPTDNLYKFCALTGTIIVILSILLPARLAISFIDELDQLTRRLSIAKVEVDYSGRKIRRLDRLIQNSINDQKSELPDPKDHLVLKYSDDEIKELLKEVDTLRKDDEIRGAEMQWTHERHKKLLKLFAGVLVLGFAGVGVGSRLAYFGYRNWYFRVQKPLDRHLAKSAPQPNDEE